MPSLLVVAASACAAVRHGEGVCVLPKPEVSAGVHGPWPAPRGTWARCSCVLKALVSRHRGVVFTSPFLGGCCLSGHQCFVWDWK